MGWMLKVGFDGTEGRMGGGFLGGVKRRGCRSEWLSMMLTSKRFMMTTWRGAFVGRREL